MAANGGAGPANNNGYPRTLNAKHPNYTKLGPNYQVVPNIASIFAGSMRQYMMPLRTAPLRNLREVSLEQIRNELVAFVTHTWKSLASTQGGDLENFGLLYGNLNMPFDVNGAGLMLGRGRVRREPIAADNPPDDATLAFLIYGGDFYTVNVDVPEHLKKKYPQAKGETSQIDYCRIIPGVGRTPTKCILIETKFGKNLYDMQPKEENQLLKSKETIAGWFTHLNNWRRRSGLPIFPPPEFEMYYVNTLIEDAGNYYAEHQSQNIGLLSKKGLAKILKVGTTQLTPAQRTTYSAKVTEVVTKMIDGVSQRLATAPLPSIAVARAWTLRDFGVDVTQNLPNFSRNATAQARGKLVSAHLPVCEDLNLQLNAMARTNKSKEIARELLLRLGWVLLWSKGPKGSTPILAPEVYRKMVERWQVINRIYFNNTEHLMAPPEDMKECNALLSFPDFCRSRSEYLKHNRLLVPVDLREGVDVIQPEEFNETDKKYIDLLTKGTPMTKGVKSVLSRTNRVQRAEEGLVKNAARLSFRGGQTVLALIRKIERNLNAMPNKPPVARLAASGITNLTQGGGAARPFNRTRMVAQNNTAQSELAAMVGVGVEPVCGAHGCLPAPQKNAGTAAKRKAASPAANVAKAARRAKAEEEERLLRAQIAEVEAQTARRMQGGPNNNNLGPFISIY